MTSSLSEQTSHASTNPAAQARWRIGVVDDHSIMRAVYRTLLEDEPRFNLLWSASSLQDARTHLEVEIPDLMIVDINMPDGDGLEFTRELLAETPELRVLVISAHEESEYPQMARDCGAHGYLCKNSTPGDVLTAIDLIQGGLFYFKPFIGPGSPSNTSVG